MPFSTIDKGSKYFDTNLYTGNNTARSITLDFSPDFVWIRSRDTAGTNHFLQDSVRGTSKIIYSNLTTAETTFTDGYVSLFNSDGYSLTTDTTGYMNYNGRTYVGWSWRGSDSSAVSNNSGSITSTVSANTTSGFSIVSYTGNGNTAASVGHSLGTTPAMMIIKKRSAIHEWTIWHKSLSSSTQSYLQFDTLAAQTSVNTWGNTAPTSSLFYVGPASVTNGSSATFIAYCFAEVKGYSAFGSYTGNGSTDGTFIYTGMRPAFIITKRTDTTSQWQLLDNKRLGYNPSNSELYAESSEGENTVTKLDILSNGFKLRTTSTTQNASGGTYIYACFAENPFVTSKGVAVTAR